MEQLTQKEYEAKVMEIVWDQIDRNLCAKVKGWVRNGATLKTILDGDYDSCEELQNKIETAFFDAGMNNVKVWVGKPLFKTVTQIWVTKLAE